MRVVNVHQRSLAATPGQVGRLVASLASTDDRLWPRDRWPAMRFEGGPAIGAAGGHGPIRYTVETWDHDGRAVRFRFTGPAGFDGWHGLELEEDGPGRTVLRHRLEMETHGPALLSWPLAFRWLHDALIEDALDRAERELGGRPPARRWSSWVRFLRWLLRPRRRRDAR